MKRLDCSGRPYALELDNGERIRARAIVIASGARYRRLGVENLTRFENAGVYYGATFVESRLTEGEEAIVIGGGNSAGQAAVYLSGIARHVHMLVRSGGLANTMSRYLIRRIEESPAITLRTRTEIVGLMGDGELTGVRWRNGATGEIEEHPVRHVFCMMGADACTDWLDGCLALDDKGFVKTGQDLSARGSGEHRLVALPPPVAPGDLAPGHLRRRGRALGEREAGGLRGGRGQHLHPAGPPGARWPELGGVSD